MAFSSCRMKLKPQRTLLRSWMLRRTSTRLVEMFPSIHLKKLKAAKLPVRQISISLLVLPPPSSLLFFFSDCHQRELPGHVGHYLQSLTPPASCDTYQDRLEQDPELQDWQGDAERLKKKKKLYISTENITDNPLTPSQTTLHDWIVVLSLYRKLNNRGQRKVWSHEQMSPNTLDVYF